MNAPNNITEAIEQLEKVARFYFPKLGYTCKLSQSGEIGDEPKYSDLSLTFDDWIIVTPYLTIENKHTIGYTRVVDCIYFKISVVNTVTSADYMCPDDVDIIEVKRMDGAIPTILEVIKLIQENQLKHIGEAFDNEECELEF